MKLNNTVLPRYLGMSLAALLNKVTNFLVSIVTRIPHLPQINAGVILSSPRESFF